MIDRVLEAEQERKARVHIMQSQDDGTAFVLAAMPRGRWSDEVRQDIEQCLVESTGASYCDHGVFVGRYDTMLIHFYLTGCQALSETESADLTEELLDLAAGWGQRLHLALTETCGAEKAEGLAIKYAHAFEDMYRRKTSPGQAAQDIQIIEAVSESSRVLVDVVQDERDQVRLRMYQLNNILLSEMLPVLDNFGLIVLDQFSDPVTLADGTIYTIDTFRLQGLRWRRPAAILERAHDLVDALEAVFTGQMTDDGINGLVVAAGIPWGAGGHDSRLPRLRPDSSACATPRFAPRRSCWLSRHWSGVWTYFHARFDPDLEGDRTAAMAEAEEAFDASARTSRP